MVPYLQAEQVSKRYADYMLFENISFTIFKDQKVALIAKNGAGKSTLMEILAGYDSPDKGKITLTNDIRVGYLKQNPVLDQGSTVLEQALKSENPILQVIQDFETAVKHNDQTAVSRLTGEMEELHAWDFELKIKQILSQLHIDQFDQKVGEMSGGQQKRLALANALVNEPDLLLLDEPTNHLDLEMIEWLENYLEKSKCTLFMVTHDRYFLDRVCNEIIEIDEDQVYSYQGNYSYYLEKRRERIEQQQASTERARNLLRTEQEWMRRMPQARGHKAKYRIDQYYELKEKAAYRRKDENLELSISSSRLGSKIIELHHISKAFGDQILIDDFSYRFSRFEKVGIIGENGSGKSTFLNILTGTIPPDQGTVDTGQTIKIGYYRQEGIDFKPEDKMIDVIKNIAEVIQFEDGSKMTASQLLTRFLFPPETQYTLIEKLSGGERRRLYLCTILMQNPNFLILDEPTNDLDIMTLGVLEDYLSGFEGCVIIVSHDRFFMDEIVDHLFVFDGNGRIKDFPGNYSIYRESLLEKEKQQKQELVPVKPKAMPVKTKSTGTKLTFKEKKELESLETEIAMLEAEKNNLLDALNSGTLSPDELMEKSRRFSELTPELEEKEMRWLELSEKQM
jgi:ATP-binding cassette subfamily F protein uup